MKQIQAIKTLAALAHDGRLSVMRYLIQAGPVGVSSGDLASAAKIGATTASAQLLTLSNAGLVKSQRRGRSVIYMANFDQFQSLISFLMEDCCSGKCSGLFETPNEGTT